VEISEKLVANLRAFLSSDRRVLTVTHANVDPIMIKHKDSSGFAAFDVGHYGALDGRNDWRDYDTVVIFGLPFRDRAWSANTFMALRGLQSTAWLNAEGNRPFQQYRDIRAALDEGKLIVAVVQAINRIRCRRVINAEGDCPPVDILLMLPPGGLGEKILDGIRTEMPGLVVKEWQYDYLKRGKAGRKANAEESVFRYAKTMLPGKHPAGEVRAHLGISPRQWERLMSTLKSPESSFACSLAERGIRYVIEGAGRSVRSYIVKT
jgi:hypothetical protein